MEGDRFNLVFFCIYFIFQSTPSAWRETHKINSSGFHFIISIHSLRMEGDIIQAKRGKTSTNISIHSLRMEGDIFCRLLHFCFCISIHSLRMEGDRIHNILFCHLAHFNPLPPHGGRQFFANPCFKSSLFQSTPSAWRETLARTSNLQALAFQSTPSAWRETAKLHRKAFFISPILVQSCKKGCKRLHSAPEKMVFFEKREKNLVRNLQHLSVRL